MGLLICGSSAAKWNVLHGFLRIQYSTVYINTYSIYSVCQRETCSLCPPACFMGVFIKFHLQSLGRNNLTVGYLLHSINVSAEKQHGKES